MPKHAVNPPHLPFPSTFSRAVAVSGNGKTLYIAGVAPVGPDGSVADDDDICAQGDTCFAKLESILGEEGGTMDDLVFLNIYVTDMSRFGELAPVRQRWLRGPVLPAISAFEVRSLVGEDWLVEVDGVGYIEGG